MSFLNPLPFFSNGVITNGMGDTKGRIINNRISDKNYIQKGRITKEGKIIDEYGACVGYVKSKRIYDLWGNYKGTM